MEVDPGPKQSDVHGEHHLKEIKDQEGVCMEVTLEELKGLTNSLEDGVILSVTETLKETKELVKEDSFETTMAPVAMECRDDKEADHDSKDE